MVGQAPVIVGFAGVRRDLDGAIVSRDRFFESAGLVVFDAIVKRILRFAAPAYFPRALLGRQAGVEF